jgi:hypothetical protein
MGRHTPDCDDGAALTRALAAVEKLGTTDAVVVPATPTASMLAAGTQAGRVKRETAERVYRAMVLIGGL